MYVKYIKRLLDFLISGIALIILSPFIAILFVIIRCTSTGPALFKQTRMGKDMHPFELYKFRTMRIDAPKNCPTHLLENPDMYITPIGKILRKTSLDELPQLFNVLIGNMSLVGPRPSLMNQNDLNELRAQNGSVHILPGITGLAQISGRDELPIPVKADYDGQYAKNISFVNDIKILIGTVSIVLKHEGVQEGKKQC